MFGKFMMFSALAAGLSAGGAHASAYPTEQPASPKAATDQLLLAQGRDVDIYYDEYGRRVVIDSVTGEILSIERPRIQAQRERRRERRDQYLGYPDELPPQGGPRDNSDVLLGPAFDEFGNPIGEAFPEAPQNPYEVEPAEPEIVSREPVERAPLANPDAGAPPAQTIIEESAPPTMAFTARDDVAALQILLDRKGASSGVIDGKFGSNVDKAIVSYRKITGQDLKSTDKIGILTALSESGGDPFTTYTITPEDAAGPFVASIPVDYAQKATLERMSYTSVTEMLGEKFHMDENYLKALNPEANFNRPGTIIKVANIGQPVTTKVKTIVADKGYKQVRAYDERGKLIAAYPATIGSSDTPSPSGTHAVTRIALNPDYTYNPKINFTQGSNTSILKIPPGPNGPVGSVWIALDKPTYGIHGTPDPSKIGKTESHGCVRLTNFDAEELAKIVAPGVTVEFME